MTVIVRNCETKKELKERARALNNGVIIGTHMQPVFYDPAITSPINGGHAFLLSEVQIGTTFTCTNHPKRSWYAEVSHTQKGLVVK